MEGRKARPLGGKGEWEVRILAGARLISKNYAEYGRKSANIASKLCGLFACSGMRGRFFVICSRGGAVARWRGGILNPPDDTLAFPFLPLKRFGKTNIIIYSKRNLGEHCDGVYDCAGSGG